MTKYYHRSKGEAVIPGMSQDNEDDIYDAIAWNRHLASLPVSAYCSPSLPIGFLPECEERYQVLDPEWVTYDKEEYDKYKDREGITRIFLVPVSAAKQEQEVKEEDVWESARLYAESKMGDKNWDRYCYIQVGIFYAHFINYIKDNYKIIPLTNGK